MVTCEDIPSNNQVTETVLSEDILIFSDVMSA